MAKKNFYKTPTHSTGTKITTKTHFGSHKEMVADCSITAELKLGPKDVVCRDDLGYYITSIDRIDNGMADPNRYANSKNRIHLEEPAQKD